jgi:hypothetical protein
MRDFTREMRELKNDEQESVSAGSIYMGSGVSPPPPLAKMTCEDRTTPNGNPYTYCYW